MDDDLVLHERKISNRLPSFPDHLSGDDSYGSGIVFLGDVNGDGVGDVAVGHPTNTMGLGSVWVFFLAPDGSVRSSHRIRAVDGGLPPGLIDFGASLACIGDRDGNGVPDLAVGATRSSSVFLLFLEKDGSVKVSREIASTHFRFGLSVAYLGDHDGDGVGDLAVGSLDATNRGRIDARASLARHVRGTRSAACVRGGAGEARGRAADRWNAPCRVGGASPSR